MMGSTIKPGITQSDATENPVARARGGIANDKATRIPGPKIASDAEIAQCTPTATTTFGATTKPSDTSDVPTATLLRKRIRPRMSAMYLRVTMRDPHTRPTNANGSAMAEAMPRARSSRPNSCSYSRDASATKPISAVARNGRLHPIRFRLSIFCTVLQLSAYDGTVSSVPITSSLAPVACRSHRPRTGSRSLSAIRAKTMVGMTNTRNGVRQPNAYANNPADNGPMNEPTALAARCVLKTLLRELIG